MNSLVGYTGFVGSNLAQQHAFQGRYNSKNIQLSFGTSPEMLVYAGVPAQKFIANQFPKQDHQVIQNAITNIQKIAPKILVLISTIDVYKNPQNVTESTPIDTNNLHPYGLNRHLLEKWVLEKQSAFDQTLILRLPGLFGQHLKKNFIYDFIHVIPSMLNQNKYNQLAEQSPLIQEHYQPQENGFYKCTTTKKELLNQLKAEFKRLNFTALQFTDSRATFQFYHLAHLWSHIQIALQHKLPLLNTATEPIEIAELYQYLTNQTFENHLDRPVPHYDYQSEHASIFGGKHGYLQSKTTVLQEIKTFVSTEMDKQA